MIRPYQSTDLSAVLTLINADQLPFQPYVCETDFLHALKSESEIDQSWWDDLQRIEVVVCEENGLIMGAAAYGVHKTESTGYVLWLHAYKKQAVITKLLKFILKQMANCDIIYAFWIATPLTTGLEGLPKQRRPKTHQALKRQGFAGEDMWLYMAGSVRKNDEQVGSVKAEGRGIVISVADADAHQGGDTQPIAQADLGLTERQLGVLWWIEVDERHRGNKLGKRLLHQAMDVLADAGAHSMILYVDHDDPAERDRRPAIDLYQSAGFVALDHLWSYQRTKHMAQ